MRDLDLREQQLTASLIQQRVCMEEGMLALQALEIPVKVEFEGDAIWLSIGGEKINCVVWPGWWEARLATREDRACEVARRLFEGWRR